MDYENAVQYIYSRQKFAKSSGHERIAALLAMLGNPQERLKFVHVVGTNGKGSVSTMLSCICDEAGYKVGLFTSPFVTEFRERIQVNGEYISKADFAEITGVIKEKIEQLEKSGLCPTFFETVFAVSLVYFEKSGCDIVVLEAGIGGRDDSTNIISAPLVAIITSVSFDHMQVLGNTLAQIAEAKCGIIKSGSTVVSFPKNCENFDFLPQSAEVCEVIERHCKNSDCRLIYPEMKKMQLKKSSIFGSEFVFDGVDYRIRLAADHQNANAATAICAAKALFEKGYKISQENICAGIEKAILPARMECVAKEPLTIIDGGHNEGCMTALLKMAEKYLSGKKITALLGFVQDKDYLTSLSIIAPYCENIVFTLADEKRGASAETLAKAADGICKNIYSINDVSSALAKAQSLCGKNNVLLCAGSFYLASKIRQAFVKETLESSD